jgi:hypothetical protein
VQTEISVSLALVQARAPLRALADVHLHWLEGEITVRRCAVFEKSGEPPWATLPRLPIEKKREENLRVVTRASPQFEDARARRSPQRVSEKNGSALRRDPLVSRAKSAGSVGGA